MNKKDFIEINKNGWNTLIINNKQFSNTILPEYGPFLKRNENEMNIMNNIKGAKVLDLGCGEGESLEYLFNKGAKEIWGLDISKEQIKKAQIRFSQFKDNFLVSPMEEEVNIPNNYFDYIISIFSIGYTSDLNSTFKYSYKYLANDGKFIISWTHPFYYCLEVVDDKAVVNKSYFNEESEIIMKGPDKVNLAQNNMMISTIINTATDNGFFLDKLYEEETVLKDDVNGYKSPFWRKEKTVNCPSTIIFVFKKH